MSISNQTLLFLIYFQQHFCYKSALPVVSDLCADDPCLNGGTCTDRNGEVTCLCLPTYGGDFCQNGEGGHGLGRASIR